MVAASRVGAQRLSPEQTLAAMSRGAFLIDTRTEVQRREQGGFEVCSLSTGRCWSGVLAGACPSVSFELTFGADLRGGASSEARCGTEPQPEQKRSLCSSRGNRRAMGVSTRLSRARRAVR